MSTTAIDRYTEFEVEHYVDSWAIFGKESDYPIAQGGRADMEIIAALLNARAKERPSSDLHDMGEDADMGVQP